MLQAAANVVRGTVPATVRPAGGSSLLLTENQQWIGGPPSLMDKLSQRERELVLKQGRRKVLYRGQTLFSQGGKHDGIWLIESGRIRVFYTSPLGARSRSPIGMSAISSAGRRCSKAPCINGPALQPAIAAWCICPERSCGPLSSRCRTSRSA